jgi:Zinc finger, ZZ type
VCSRLASWYLVSNDWPRGHLDVPDPAVHDGITCNGCKINPIRGIRWKCMECDDYDLCNACRSSGTHPPSHKMLKLESPEDAEALKEAVRDFRLWRHSAAIHPLLGIWRG